VLCIDPDICLWGADLSELGRGHADDHRPHESMRVDRSRDRAGDGHESAAAGWGGRRKLRLAMMGEALCLRATGSGLQIIAKCDTLGYATDQQQGFA
jgi:hypothetical protein